jgi:hypothetical protein
MDGVQVEAGEVQEEGEVRLAVDIGAVRSFIHLIHSTQFFFLHPPNSQQVLTDPALSAPPTTVPGPPGRPVTTGAPPPGPHGGAHLHVRHLTGLAGLPGPGVLQRRGPRGLGVRPRPQRRVWGLPR